MVRECRPPAREPASSWLARRSTMATSTPANASSPASISPVGPPPTITTACSVISPRTSRFSHRAAMLLHDAGLPASPPVRYILKVPGSRHSPPLSQAPSTQVDATFYVQGCRIPAVPSVIKTGRYESGADDHERGGRNCCTLAQARTRAAAQCRALRGDRDPAPGRHDHRPAALAVEAGCFQDQRRS